MSDPQNDNSPSRLDRIAVLGLRTSIHYNCEAHWRVGAIPGYGQERPGTLCCAILEEVISGDQHGRKPDSTAGTGSN
jgi:hypothetical protein